MSINRSLRALLAASIALVAAIALAACGGDDEVGGGSDADVEVAKPGPPVEGEFNISNWVGYIDKGEGSTIEEFEAKYPGTTVNYTEDINDNAEFFGKVQPLLDQGESGGRSMFVVTDYMAKQMYDLGYLQEIDYADVPNVDANLKDSLRSPEFDPERKFSIPWQSGMTGLLVNEKLAPDVQSVNDLFDPKYKGKVTVLTEMRDTIPLMLKADGIDPLEATTEQWLEQIDKLQAAVDDGQLRRFTGNDYVQDLDNENVVAAIGWSGDVSLIANEDVDWRMPDRRLHHLVGQHGDPGRGAEHGGGAGVGGLRLRPEGPGRHLGLRPLREPGPGRRGNQSGSGQRRAGQPARTISRLIAPRSRTRRAARRTCKR